MSAERPHRSYVQGLAVVEGWQDAGQAASQHGLSGTGRATQQQVVPSRGRHHQRIHRVALTDDVGQVRCNLPLAHLSVVGGHSYRFGVDRFGIQAVTDCGIAQADDGPHLDSLHQLRLRTVGIRHDHACESRLARGENRRQRTGHWAKPAIQPHLTHVHGPLE